jgi:hypothetical protein
MRIAPDHDGGALGQRRAKQVVLAVVARLAHPSPLQRISPSKESRTAQIENPKTQETAINIGLSCKIEYLFRSHSDQSMTFSAAPIRRSEPSPSPGPKSHNQRAALLGAT